MKKNQKKQGKVGIFTLIQRFLPYYRPYRKVLFLDLFCALLTTGSELLLPMLVREITGKADGGAEALTVRLIVICGVAYLVMRLIDTVAYYYMANIGHVMGCQIETNMRRDFFAHLQKLSFAFYDNTKIGTLMSRITSDLFDVTEFAHHCPEEYFIAAVKIIGSCIILCTINPLLTLITFALIPVMVIVLFHFNSKMKATFRESRVRVGELNAQIEDSLLGIREVRSFVNEPLEEAKFDHGNQNYLKVKRKNYKVMGMFQCMTRFFEGMLYIIVVVAGAFFLRLPRDHVLSITPADYAAFLLYVSVLFTSIRRIVEFTEQFQRGMTGIERFCEIMDIHPDIQDAPDAQEIKSCRGELTFENVTFHYTEESKNVLTALSVHIRAGESVAIVGPSGGGKTTLCSLIPRFYDIQDGKILLDGQDIEKIKLASLRRQIGIVQQNVYLFSGSIRENIAYGKANATDAEIEAAAKLAGADAFISELPDGYDTYVGERGVKLSGGQKQRISIARVFLKDPPILILDEATSALDNESERLVQQSLERLAKGRTTITIAHRLTTIRNADRILVLTADGIAEEGSHAELIAKGGMYADLYRLYTSD